MVERLQQLEKRHLGATVRWQQSRLAQLQQARAVQALKTGGVAEATFAMHTRLRELDERLRAAYSDMVEVREAINELMMNARD